MKYCVFTQKEMYVVEADYIKVTNDGVLFFVIETESLIDGFKKKERCVAFVPSMSLELVREHSTTDKVTEMAKQRVLS